MKRWLACVLGLGLLLGWLGGAASAQDRGQDAGQDATRSPVPDPGTTPQSNCIAEGGTYRREGNRFDYVISLENKCERQIRCVVFAYVVQAKGPSSGRVALVLAPRSKGAAAKKSYALRVRMSGGIAQTTRECRAD